MEERKVTVCSFRYSHKSNAFSVLRFASNEVFRNLDGALETIRLKRYRKSRRASQQLARNLAVPVNHANDADKTAVGDVAIG